MPFMSDTKPFQAAYQCSDNGRDGTIEFRQLGKTRIKRTKYVEDSPNRKAQIENVREFARLP